MTAIGEANEAKAPGAKRLAIDHHHLSPDIRVRRHQQNHSEQNAQRLVSEIESEYLTVDS